MLKSLACAFAIVIASSVVNPHAQADHQRTCGSGYSPNYGGGYSGLHSSNYGGGYGSGFGLSYSRGYGSGFGISYSQTYGNSYNSGYSQRSYHPHGYSQPAYPTFAVPRSYNDTPRMDYNSVWQNEYSNQYQYQPGYYHR